MIAVQDRPIQSATDADLIPKVVEEHLQANPRLVLSGPEPNMLGASTQPSEQNPEDTAHIQPLVEPLETQVQEIGYQVDSVESKLHDLSNELAVLQEGLPELLRQALDPLKHSVGQDIQRIRVDMMAQQQTSRALSATQLDSILEDTKVLKTEWESFRRTKTDESSLYEKQILEVKNELALKADTATMNGLASNLGNGIRNLTHRYENISTDELFKKMANWLLETYPASPANLLNQVAIMQHEVENFKDFIGRLNWLTSRSHDFNALLTSAPQLKGLARSADSLQRLVLPESRIHEACKEAQEAIAMVKNVEKTQKDKTEAIQSTDAAVKVLQQSLTNINSPSSPFVRTSAINALKTDIEDIQKSRAETDTRISLLESASPALRQDIDRIRNDFVEPNKEALAMYGAIVLTLGQLQEVVRVLYQQNPALENIPFTYDLSAKPAEPK
jgi:peptidoglycan hydrolase CwlO-like protein